MLKRQGHNEGTEFSYNQVDRKIREEVNHYYNGV